jgi:hypothetical protein
MDVVYSDHAKKRLKQRGITKLEAEQVLFYPLYIKKSFFERKIAVGVVNNRTIKVLFVEKKNYINIVTVI